jgi:hypothetical protein
MLRASWENGTARIVERRCTQAATSDARARYKYVVDVEVPGKPRFHATMSDRFMTGRFVPPRPGQVVQVKVDVERQKAKFDKSDPGLDPRNAAAARLQELAELKAQGRLTDAEYEYFRQGIKKGTVVIEGRRYGPLDVEGD